MPHPAVIAFFVLITYYNYYLITCMGVSCVPMAMYNNEIETRWYYNRASRSLPVGFPGCLYPGKSPRTLLTFKGKMANILFQIFHSTGEIAMYAIIESGGKQYRIAEGEKVRIEKVAGKCRRSGVARRRSLLVDDGERTLVGSPYIEGASVTGR